MDRMRNWIFVVVFTLLGGTLMAQNVIVRSSTDFRPVKNVFVYNQDHKIAVLTDSTGIIDLGMFSSSDSLVFQHPSFVRFTSLLRKLGQMITWLFLM